MTPLPPTDITATGPFKLAKINTQIQLLPSGYAGQVYDGHHTFDEIYQHRVTLFCALARLIAHDLRHPHYREVWRARTGDADSFLAGIGFAPGKQISYHILMSEWDKFWFCSSSKNQPEWDGHTSDDVLTRLAVL